MLDKIMKLLSVLELLSPSHRLIRHYREEFEQLLKEDGRAADLQRFPSGEYVDEAVEQEWQSFKTIQEQNDLSL
ncbi:hypothetical protein [Pseudomonas sp. SDO52101_S400]